MFSLRRALIGKKVKILGEISRRFGQYSSSDSLTAGNQTTEKPFGTRLPANSDLNALQHKKQIYVDKSLQILELIDKEDFR